MADFNNPRTVVVQFKDRRPATVVEGATGMSFNENYAVISSGLDEFVAVESSSVLQIKVEKLQD